MTSSQYQVNSSYKQYTQRHLMPVEGRMDGLGILSTVGETLPSDSLWDALIVGLDNDREATNVLAHLTIPGLEMI